VQRLIGGGYQVGNADRSIGIGIAGGAIVDGAARRAHAGHQLVD
jgi:hypothetical protein